MHFNIFAMRFGFAVNPYQHSCLEVVLSGLEVAWIWPFCLGYPCFSHLHLKAIGQIFTTAETIVRDMPVPSKSQYMPFELCGAQPEPVLQCQKPEGRRQKACLHAEGKWQKAIVACANVFCTSHHNVCTQPDIKLPDIYKVKCVRCHQLQWHHQYDHAVLKSTDDRSRKLVGWGSTVSWGPAVGRQ